MVSSRRAVSNTDNPRPPARISIPAWLGSTSSTGCALPSRYSAPDSNDVPRSWRYAANSSKRRARNGYHRCAGSVSEAKTRPGAGSHVAGYGTSGLPSMIDPTPEQPARLASVAVVAAVVPRRSKARRVQEGCCIRRAIPDVRINSYWGGLPANPLEFALCILYTSLAETWCEGAMDASAGSAAYHGDHAAYSSDRHSEHEMRLSRRGPRHHRLRKPPRPTEAVDGSHAQGVNTKGRARCRDDTPQPSPPDVDKTAIISTFNQ